MQHGRTDSLPAVEVFSRRHLEVSSHRHRRCAVLTAENADCRSHVCSSGVALVGFSFGASRRRVNKDVVAAAPDALLRSAIAPRSLSRFSLNVCRTLLVSPRPPPPPLVCSLLTEFRGRCWSACPSRTPSAFTASTHCAGGECCFCSRDSDMSDYRIFKGA